MIVRIDNDYILNENLNVALNRLHAVVGNGIINQIISQPWPVPLHIGSPDDVVFIFTHGGVGNVGGYNVDQLSAIFQNPIGKTFVLISCKAGIANNLNDSFAQEFARRNKCRVLAPIGCSVFSDNGIAVIPESEVEKYSNLQDEFENEGLNGQVLNKMFNACSVDENCFTVRWNVLNSIDQLKGYGFRDIDARP